SLSGPTPLPPYFGFSDDHKMAHSESCGGASNGSGSGARIISTPRFTNNNRSDRRSSEKKRRTKLELLSTAPSMPHRPCAEKIGSLLLIVKRSACRSYHPRRCSRWLQSSLHRWNVASSHGSARYLSSAGSCILFHCFKKSRRPLRTLAAR